MPVGVMFMDISAPRSRGMRIRSKRGGKASASKSQPKIHCLLTYSTPLTFKKLAGKPKRTFSLGRRCKL